MWQERPKVRSAVLSHSVLENLEARKSTTLQIFSISLCTVRMTVHLKWNRPFIKGQRLAEQARRRRTETGGISSSGIRREMGSSQN